MLSKTEEALATFIILIIRGYFGILKDEKDARKYKEFRKDADRVYGKDVVDRACEYWAVRFRECASKQ